MTQSNTKNERECDDRRSSTTALVRLVECVVFSLKREGGGGGALQEVFTISRYILFYIACWYIMVFVMGV